MKKIITMCALAVSVMSLAGCNDDASRFNVSAPSSEQPLTPLEPSLPTDPEPEQPLIPLEPSTPIEPEHTFSDISIVDPAFSAGQTSIDSLTFVDGKAYVLKTDGGATTVFRSQTRIDEKLERQSIEITEKLFNIGELAAGLNGNENSKFRVWDGSEVQHWSPFPEDMAIGGIGTRETIMLNGEEPAIVERNLELFFEPKTLPGSGQVQRIVSAPAIDLFSDTKTYIDTALKTGSIHYNVAPHISGEAWKNPDDPGDYGVRYWASHIAKIIDVAQSANESKGGDKKIRVHKKSTYAAKLTLTKFNDETKATSSEEAWGILTPSRGEPARGIVRKNPITAFALKLNYNKGHGNTVADDGSLVFNKIIDQVQKAVWIEETQSGLKLKYVDYQDRWDSMLINKRKGDGSNSSNFQPPTSEEGIHTILKEVPLAVSSLAVITRDDEHIILMADKEDSGLFEVSLSRWVDTGFAELIPSPVGRNCLSDMEALPEGLFCKEIGSPDRFQRVW